MTCTIITAEELGLKPKVWLGEEAGNHGFDHERLVAAFKANGLRPVTSAAELMEALLGGFEGHIPDLAFFEDTMPTCPYFGGEFYQDEFLSVYGGWPPNTKWLLKKE